MPFKVGPKKAIEDFTGILELAMRKVLVDVDSDVVFGTRVDTGRARGGWTAGINSSGGEGGLDPSGSATIAKITAAANRFKIGDTFVTSNNVPYIEFLENGHRSFAGDHMVSKALARVPARIKL